jgi:hypothetical protein
MPAGSPHMPLESNQEAIGDYLYLFKSPEQTDKCLISAHGGYYKNQKTFKLSDIASNLRVVFYGDHNKVLQDPGLGILSRNPTIVDDHPTDGNDVLDYVLSKYQGRHSSANETYKTIGDKLKNDSAQIQSYRDQMDYVNSNPSIRKIYDSLASCHVVTIRNRWNKSDVSLKYVINAVHNYMSSITSFHCSFCRSLIGDPNPETSRVITTAVI